MIQQFVWRVAESGDDCTVSSGGSFSSDAIYCTVGKVGSDAITSCFRFRNVSLPEGADVINVSLRVFSRDGSQLANISSKLTCLAEDNAPAVSSAANLASRTQTTAQAGWPITGGWGSYGEFGRGIIEPVLEVMSRPGYAGDALVVVWSDDGSGSDSNRQVMAFDAGFPDYRPALQIVADVPSTRNTYGRRARLLRP